MRVLWLCNSELDFISNALGHTAPVSGGWMNGAAGELLNGGQVSLLVICYPQTGTRQIVKSSGASWVGYGFPYGRAERCDASRLIPTFEALIDEVRPDVVHAHGTEFPYCESMMRAVEAKCVLEKTRISIQGLVSICASHLLDGIPTRISSRRTLSEVKNGMGLAWQVRDYARRGESERTAIKLTRGIIGRTEWDRVCCEQINPSIVYHHCGETLRDEFYVAEPGRDASSHAIFFSQGDKPIKGIHMLIRALPFIRRAFPDMCVRVSGSSGFRSDPVRGTGYGIYCRNLAAKLGVLDAFEFLGTLDALHLVGAMKRCACFVSASAMENSSNSLGEAMMLGLPCVSSFVGGMPSMAANGIEAIFYPFAEPNMLADAVIGLLADEERADALGNAGRVRALENHSRAKNNKELLDIYSRTAGWDLE